MVTEKTQMQPVHRLAALLYMLSVGLLLGGIWILIDPFDRHTGQRAHVYITLIAMELYIWLLLLLGRWQRLRGLRTFMARSGLVALGLTGIQFMALNELHMARANEAYLLSPLFTGLAVTRLFAARRWLRLFIPTPMIAYAIVWIVLLALPANIYRSFAPDDRAQHLAGWLSCWAVSGFIAAHLFLVLRQHRIGWPPTAVGGWLVVAGLAFLATIQLYTTMWGMYIRWAQWYFSPVYLSAGVMLVCAATSARLFRPQAWLLLALAILFTACVRTDPIPADMPTNFPGGLERFLLHPYHPAALFTSFLLFACGMTLRQVPLAATGLLGPITWGGAEGTRAMLYYSIGKGLACVLGAFVLLAFGAILQWWQESQPPADPTSPVEEPPLTDNPTILTNLSNKPSN